MKILHTNKKLEINKRKFEKNNQNNMNLYIMKLNYTVSKNSLTVASVFYHLSNNLIYFDLHTEVCFEYTLYL